MIDGRLFDVKDTQAFKSNFWIKTKETRREFLKEGFI